MGRLCRVCACAKSLSAMPTIKVEIAMCNVKKLDTKAYGIEKPDCTVVVGIEGTDLSFTTQTQRGLDPQFEVTATFEVKDVTKDRLFGKFFMNKNTKLQIELAMCNVKKIDTKAYGVEKPDCTAKVTLNGVSFTTRTEKGLDPQWDQTVVLGVTDPAKDRLSGKFFMNQGEKQIGDEQFFNLDKLVAGKSTFKGIIVPGGTVDMFVTALNFGVEEKEENVEDMGFMNTLDDDEEGGMMMSDSEEED